MKPLTERQRQVYEFIADSISCNGFPPTLREIGEAFGFSSTNAVLAVLDALERKGYIHRHPSMARGIELVGELPPGAEGVRVVPILGRVRAGQPLLAQENLEGTLAVSRAFVPPGKAFALKVEGDSMAGAGILDGDYVIALCQPTAHKGDIVVAVLGEEATVKRYMPEEDKIVLMPENPQYAPIVVDASFPEEFRIAGRVVALMRRI
ncbi:MAG TPA: transcriptional repressor LexA [Candidatus Latescibacteria bacterium]|nr:transcriptional repressor LexA [Candidatus Latescibacterota bacterium]